MVTLNMESQKTMGVCIQKIASKMQKPLGGKGLLHSIPYIASYLLIIIMIIIIIIIIIIVII